MGAPKHALLIVVSIICCVILYYTTQIRPVRPIDLSQLNIQADNQAVKYYLEMIKNEKKSLVVKGWALNTDQAQQVWDKTIIVLLSKDSTFIKIPTRIYARPDVVKHTNSSDYAKNAGFTASVIKQHIDAGTYEIHLLLGNQNQSHLINTHETVKL